MLIGWRYDRFAELVGGERLETLCELDGVKRSKETVRSYMTKGGTQPTYTAGYAFARHFDVHPHYLAGLRATPGRFPRQEAVA